ncbi:(2Fe-2S) ferredoxin domain-containing protein [Bdellovibrio sp. HCB337]|uniref:(2Fe-2S) ferredoxin domain-containing protein n=1 Tax=Bdellovibrio sp. HCB337 TaxID=3394358 RepID=UPI0039A4FDD4
MAVEKQKTAWSDAVVLICEKCGKSLDDLKLKEDGNASENMKKYLKSQMKERGHGKQIRVINSGCLDICIKNKVAVSYNPIDTNKHTQQTFTVHPEEDREQILSYLISTLKK